MRFAGFRGRFIGRTQFRIFQLAGNAHGRAQIIGADQQRVYPGQCGNGIGIRNAFRRLQHGNEHSCGIGLVVDLAKRGLPIALQRAGAADRTFAQRRETASAHKCLGFAARADIRADNPKRAHIEQARCVIELVTGDTTKGVTPTGKAAMQICAVSSSEIVQCSIST